MLTRQALEYLEARYFLRNAKGFVTEDADGLFRRVATAVAAAEETDRPYWEGIFFEMMHGLQFLPNSPTLMNAGLPGGQLSACFALPVPDSIRGIFDSVTSAAVIHQSGGGTGFNFSGIRPKGDFISQGQGKAPGPLSFIRVFDCATEEIKQAGRRRGANMGILNADHPDIEAFIHAKETGDSLQNFNLSIGVTDAFMEAVSNGASWSLINPRDGRVMRRVDAADLWEGICESAWACGDPGLVFLDTVNRDNPLPDLGRLDCTNPCGELPLFPYESCNLGSLNLARMLREDPHGKPGIDWELLGRCVGRAVRFLDNVITVNPFPLPEIRSVTLANRKIGLGVMGWAECLLRMGIPYASSDAIVLADHVMAFISRKSQEASESLGRLRGCFPNQEQNRIGGEVCRRNATLNSIAPTGSISVIAGTSYSIEPFYALAYKRSGILNGREQSLTEPAVREILQDLGFWDSEVVAILRETGSVASLQSLAPELRRRFQTAHEIHWRDHLKHQQAFQRHTDNAVSKTINLPATTTVTDISKLFVEAWEMQLKGVTVYRDGSKARQVLKHCRQAPDCPL